MQDRGRRYDLGCLTPESAEDGRIHRGEEGHDHLNEGTEHHSHLLVEQPCGWKKGAPQNMEFYDAFMCFSGLKSTYPNWGWAVFHVLWCMALHKAHCNAVQCCRRAARHSGMCFCVSQHLQSGKKPQGNVLVLPDQIYYYVEKTAVEHLSDNDTIVDMRNQRNTVSQELKPCGLCWNQNRDSGAGQSRTIQCNPPTMTATQSREKKTETT